MAPTSTLCLTFSLSCLRWVALLFIYLLASLPVQSQVNLTSEETSYFNATGFEGLGRRVGIGTDFVVAQPGPATFGFDDFPYDPLLIWDIGNGSLVKILNNDQPQAPFGAPIIPFSAFSVSQDEIVTSTGSVHPPRLYRKDQGGTNNWGFVQAIGSSGATDARISGDRIVTLNVTSLALNIYERDQDGAENWGLVRNLTLNAAPRVADLDSEVYVYAVSLPPPHPFEVRIRQRDAGGNNNWGLVKSITYPGVSELANFVTTLAISGDTLVVGAGIQGAGSNEVFVYQQDVGGTDNWGLVTTLIPTANSTASVPNDRSSFGVAVDIDGDNVIVGSPGTLFPPGTFDPGVHAGRYFLFNRNQGGADQWGQSGAFLMNTDQGDQRGNAVAIAGDNFVVGIRRSSEIENGVDTNLSDSGGIGVGVVPQSAVPQVNDTFFSHLELVASNSTFAAKKIAANGNHLVFSSELNAPIRGPSVTTFQRGPFLASSDLEERFNPQEVRKLATLTRKQPVSNFGSDLSINNGGWLVVGDRSARENPSNGGKGEAYLYRLQGPGILRWRFEKTLEPDEAFSGDQFFGEAVHLQDELLAVGAPFDGWPTAGSAGAVYLYGLNVGGPENWGAITRLGLDNPQNSDRFGSAVSMDGHTLAVGVPGHNGARGAVAVFDKDQGGPDSWGLSQFIVAPSTQTDEQFGISIELQGDRLVVGGEAERAYLFERSQSSNDSWEHKQTLTDQDGFNSGDRYGSKVALGEDRIAIAAPNKVTASNGSGVVRIYEYSSGLAEFSAITDLVASDGATNPGFAAGDLTMFKDDIFVGSSGSEFQGRFRGKVYLFNRPPTITEVALQKANKTTTIRGRELKKVLGEDIVEAISLRFSQNVFGSPDLTNDPEINAFNPDNYLLISTGQDRSLQSTNCLDGIQGDDLAIPFASVVYDSESQTTTLSLAPSNHLKTGKYRLLTCGTTSIFSFWNDKLDGNYDGNGGDDFTLDFEIAEGGLCVPIKAQNQSVVLICL